MNPRHEQIKQEALLVVGAVLGGVAGYFLFFWLVRQGFYALVAPGGMLGIGAGLGRTRYKVLPVICGIVALILGLVCEWQFAPFIVDNSFGYFLTHLQDLDHKVVTLGLLAIGTALGFWVPFRRRG